MRRWIMEVQNFSLAAIFAIAPFILMGLIALAIAALVGGFD